jgi:hypothetical protein
MKTIKESIGSLGSNRYGNIRHAAKLKTRTRIQKCENCGYDKHVETCHLKPIALFHEDTPVDIVNADSNLKLLCPNCHWEHDSIARLELKKILTTCKCGYLKHRDSATCRSCRIIIQEMTASRKVQNRPSKEELDELVKTMPMTAIGKKYGVSDNAIRKWIKKYNKKMVGTAGFEPALD